MDHLQRTFCPPCAIDQLQMAARVGRDDHGRAGGKHVFHLSLLQLRGHFELGDVVNSRAPATPGGFLQLDQFQSRDSAQNTLSVAAG